MIKRYKLTGPMGCEPYKLEHPEGGDWVKFEDHKKEVCELVEILEELIVDAPISPWSHPECSSDVIENERYRIAELIRPLITKHKKQGV